MRYNAIEYDTTLDMVSDVNAATKCPGLQSDEPLRRAVNVCNMTYTAAIESSKALAGARTTDYGSVVRLTSY